MEATLDKFETSNQKGRKIGRKEKSNVFSENLNESDHDIPLECLEEQEVTVDRLSGVSCVSINCCIQFKIFHCDCLKMRKEKICFF